MDGLRSRTISTLAHFPGARCDGSGPEFITVIAAPQLSHWGKAHVTQRGGFMGSEDSYSHVSVLAERCFELLRPALTGSHPLMVDLTLGLGGHTEYFLERVPGLRIIAIDRDEEAIASSRSRLAPFADRLYIHHARFDDIALAHQESPFAGDPVQAILGDFGVSSLQLDDADRGFSYAQDADLDMRMDTSTGPTAAELLQTLSRREITRILQVYGEERFAPSIAGLIVKERDASPLSRTSELVDLIYRAIPAAARRHGGHPAKRTFQALRIAVNGELEAIEEVLPRGFEALAPGGRFACMSFQSLEDSLVKKYFTEITTSRTPAGLPMELPGYEPYADKLTRGAEKASAAEIAANPRAASVRLRAVEKRPLTSLYPSNGNE